MSHVLRPAVWLPLGSLVLWLACGLAAAQEPTAPPACHFVAPTPRSTAALSRIADAAADPNTDSGRGLGGSGYTTEERGISGSGIVGVVTGFGSICVNGYEVELTDRSVITVENRPATAADIRLGHVVVVEALRSDDKLVAATVDVRLAAVGPIASIAEDGATFTILGQTVKLASFGGSATDSFAVGDWVAVSGLRRADASIEGTSVVRLPAAGTRAMVAGTVTADQTGALALGRLAVAGVARGDTVVVEGVPQNGALTAARVIPRSGIGFSPTVRAASVQTFVPGESTMGLSAGAPALAATERPVQIEGRIGADGNFAIGRAEPAAPPLEGLRALRELQIERGGVLRAPPLGPDGRPPLRPLPDGARGERPLPGAPIFRQPPDRGDKQIERPPPRPEPRGPVPTLQK